MQNFGNINNAFNEILIDGIIKKNTGNKETYQKYLKALKENRVLKTQYLVYNNLESKVESDSTKAMEYVSENISLLQQFTKKEIEKANGEILALLGENNKFLNVDYTKKELHENINYLISNNKKATNIEKIVESRHTIKDYIIKNEVKEPISESITPTKVLIEITTKKFNEKYDLLDETTKLGLKAIIGSSEETQKILYVESVDRCLNLVNEKLKNSETDTKEKLLEVKEKLLKMNYNKEEFSQGVIKLINLENDLK